MKQENIIYNIMNAYTIKGLYFWSDNFPLKSGDVAKRDFINNHVNIVGLVDRPKFRAYVIATDWVGDPVIEFKMMLTKNQKAKMKKEFYNEVSTINDEKSRWVTWGTSIDPLTKLGIFEAWAKQATKLAEKIIRIKVKS
jgi:hypothetical protein